MKKYISIILTISMLLSMMTCMAFAAESDLDEIVETYLDKTADGLHKNDQTGVSLTFPGTANGNIDVVFLCGGGMTANMQTIESAINVFKPAMESGKATVRVGLISLEKGKEIILDLNSDEAVLDPDTYVEFLKAKFDDINDLPAGSTNLHSQLLEAQKMLEKETEAEDSNKYVFLLATGRTYWFDNVEGEQSTVVNKVNGTYYWGNYLWQSQRGRHTSLYMIPDSYKNSYEAFFADIEKWVAADGDKYVYTPHFDVNDYSAYINWEKNNNKDLKALGVASSRFGNGIVNPKPTEENFITGVMAGASSSNSPANALNYERAQYECVQVWKQLVANGYNCYSICSENPNYQNGSEYITQGAKYTGTSRSQVGHSFMNYLATLAGQEYAPTVWDYERNEDGSIKSAKTVLKEDFFKPIQNDMYYTYSNGSTIVDYIGLNENGNYEFIQNENYIHLSLGGVEYKTAKIETKEGYDFSVSFTAPGATEPTFWLDYVYGDGRTTEHYVLTFGESVTVERLANLTFELHLIEKQEIPGTYEVPTSNSAILYPIDSDGKEGKPSPFPIPTVTYTVTGRNISGVKIWNDGENQDGIRPESIVINLLANGEIVDTVEVTAADEWKYSFTNLPKNENGVEIVYTIEEVAVDGYETTYDGYNVINTHIVRTSITLDGIKYLDADVAEGFTFVLTDVNGNKIATVVSGADGKFTFAELVYTEEGTYVYYISEIIGEDDEIIYDENIYTVTVVVTSDGEKLNASVTLAKDGVSYEGDIEFYNETETILNDDPTPLDPPKEPNPETGDNTSVIALVIAGAIVTLGVVIKSKSRRFE